MTNKFSLKLVKRLIKEGLGRRKIAAELGISEWEARLLISEVVEKKEEDRSKKKSQPTKEVGKPRHKAGYSGGKPTVIVRPSKFAKGIDPIDQDIPTKIQKRDPSYSVAMLGDFHYPYQNRAAVTLAKAYLQDNTPDCIVFMGDLLDAYAVSRYDKDPERKYTFQEEIDYTHERLIEWVYEFPGVEFYFLTGNHETRNKRLLKKYANQLNTLRSMKVEELLGLKELGIEALTEDKDLEIGDLTFVHGEFARKHAGSSARATFDQVGASVIQGHCHRGSISFKRNKQGIHSLIESMCMCDLDVEYARFPDWVNGFATAHFDGEDFHAEIFPIPGNKLITSSKVYTV